MQERVAETLPLVMVLDGQGGGETLTWEAFTGGAGEGRMLWIHLDRSDEAARTWLTRESGLDALTCQALLAEETRPRSLATGEGLMVILRGVNLHPEADPEDMVSVRIWAEAGRLITLRSRRLMAVQEVRRTLHEGHGPRDCGEVLVALAGQLVQRMGPLIEGMDEQVDDLEEEVLTAHSWELRVRLSALRRQAIALRRYMAPQREVLARLQNEPVPWLSPLGRGRLREVADRLTRYVEDLDSARERAAVTQEELAGRTAEQMNRTMYVLSLVAAIFLPLGLITGLLGINVGGIPGAEFPWAFLIVCGLLVVLALLQLVLFKRMKWF